MDSQKASAITPPATVVPLKYSNRVLLQTILERSDDGLGLVDQRVTVGGWVRSSKEVKEEIAAVAPPPVHDSKRAAGSSKDLKYVEVLQSRIPFLRTMTKVLGSCGSAKYAAVSEKLEPLISEPSPPPSPFFPSPPPPSLILVLQVNDGSCVKNLQVVVDSAIAPELASQLQLTGTCILAEGVLKISAQGKQAIELTAEKILHVGTVEQDSYPLSRKRSTLDSVRDWSHFGPRTTVVASVTRIRNALTFATHTFFQNEGFLYVQVPIITSTVAEGFSEKFQVTTVLEKTSEEEPVDTEGIVSLDIVKAAIKEKSDLVEQLNRSESDHEALNAAVEDLRKTNLLAENLQEREKSKQGISVKPNVVYFNEEFFSGHTYLTASGHLHLESYACSLGQVYSFGPRFRAHRMSTKPIAEMWILEVEIAFSELQDVMKCADNYFKFLCKWILDNCSEDMKFVSKRIDKEIIDRLQSLISCTCEKISYTEAVDLLRKVMDGIFETELQWGVALTPEHLSYLADELYKKPVIIYDYPKAVKPFYVRLNDDGSTVAAFDMVIPQVGTLITGSQNEERLSMLTARIKELNLPEKQYEWYIDLRRNGTVKHSGFSIGFDLMVLLAAGLTDIRDAVPFPRSYGKANN